MISPSYALDVEESSRANSFDAFRLFAAWLVVVGHGFILAGKPELAPRLGKFDVSVIGVVIFFTISGFLIWKSWSNRASWQGFIAARVLRIFPALIVVIIITTFVFGPLVTTFGLPDYFGSAETYLYLQNIFVFNPQYSLPGVFSHQPFTSAVNGSLWTLRAELLCYLAVPLLFILPRKMRPVIVFSVTAILLFGATNFDLVLWGNNLSIASFYWGFFGIGALVASLEIEKKLPLPSGIILIVIWVISAESTFPIIKLLGLFALGIGLIAISSKNLPYLRRASRYGDFSYGCYLVAFPVQQTILLISPGMPLIYSVCLTLLISTTIGLILWYLVERRSLRLKASLSSFFSRS